MDTLDVVRVEPFAPGSESASVTLRSEKGEITVFCFPCELSAGDTIPNLLSGMVEEVQAAYLSDWPEEIKEEKSLEFLERGSAPFSYRGCGRVLNQESGLIEVLGFRIELGDAPCDGTVEFECERIDVRPYKRNFSK